MRQLTAFILALLVLNSCTKKFGEINTNPYEVNPANLTIEAQLVKPMAYVYAPHQNMFQFYTNLSVDLFSGYFMTPHNFGGNGNADYRLNRGFCGGVYENYYLNIFNITSKMIPICEDKKLTDYAAVTRIVQTYATIVATDSYGPISFKSVVERSPNIYYDSQKDIYTQLFKDVEQSASELKDFLASNPSADRIAGLAKFDQWCNGDHSLWIKIANTLKLRMAIRLSKVDAALAKTKAEEAVAAGVLTDADPDVVIDKNQSNELTRMFDWGDCGVNASLVTILTGYGDPRLPLYITQNTGDVKNAQGNVIVAKGTQYLGVRAGCTLPNKPNAWENYSRATVKYTTPLPVMKVAEIYFLRAEGALRGWNMGGTAKNFYEQGIRTSIKNEYKYLSSSLSNPQAIADATIAQYINGELGRSQNNYVDPADASNNYAAMNTLSVKWDDAASNEQKLQRIITQKWLANFPISNEAWAEFRRTGYPKLYPVKNNLSDGTIDTNKQIRRLIYSNVEYNTNKTELDKGIGILGGPDNGGTQVWWDTNAGVSNF